ncbi:MAG: hypothetical protein WHV67_08040, partial [Thermoanaerobaculia bacterium]
MLKLKKKSLKLNKDREFAFKCIEESNEKLKNIKLLLKEKEYSEILIRCHYIFEFFSEGILRSAGRIQNAGGFIWIQVGSLLKEHPEYSKECDEYYNWAEWFTIHQEIHFYIWLNVYALESDKKRDAKKAIKGAIFALKL